MSETQTEGLHMTPGELQVVRQWFEACKDTHAGFLEPADHVLARRIYQQLGLRVPHSVLAGGADS